MRLWTEEVKDGGQTMKSYAAWQRIRQLCMHLSGKRQHRVYESETVTRSVDVCLDVCLSKTYKNSAQKKTHQNISNGYPTWQG